MKPGARRPRREGSIRCTQTAVTDRGERIFALEGDHLSTGGMTESELRVAAALLDQVEDSRAWRETKAVIDDALAKPPRHFAT